MNILLDDRILFYIGLFTGERIVLSDTDTFKSALIRGELKPRAIVSVFADCCNGFVTLTGTLHIKKQGGNFILAYAETWYAVFPPCESDPSTSAQILPYPYGEPGYSSSQVMIRHSNTVVLEDNLLIAPPECDVVPIESVYPYAALDQPFFRIGFSDLRISCGNSECPVGPPPADDIIQDFENPVSLDPNAEYEMVLYTDYYNSSTGERYPYTEVWGQTTQGLIIPEANSRTLVTSSSSTNPGTLCPDGLRSGSQYVSSISANLTMGLEGVPYTSGIYRGETQFGPIILFDGTECAPQTTSTIILSGRMKLVWKLNGVEVMAREYSGYPPPTDWTHPPQEFTGFKTRITIKYGIEIPVSNLVVRIGIEIGRIETCTPKAEPGSIDRAIQEFLRLATPLGGVPRLFGYKVEILGEC